MDATKAASAQTAQEMDQADARRSDARRFISQALREARTRDETESLLGDEEHAGQDGSLHDSPDPSPRVDPHCSLPIYKTIHRIRRLVQACIDDPYTLEQLKGPQMNASVVRPLVDRLYDPDDISTVYCLLANRVQFIRDQTYRAHHQSVNLTRATLCELIASRVLRRFNHDNPGRQGLVLLANILVAGFEPFQNAPEEVIRENKHAMQWALQKRGGHEKRLTALEIAIISESKSFLSSTACQKVVEAVYLGRIVYTPTSFIDILPDHYKHTPISIYDPRKAPLLNQYRLIVPRTRNIIEVGQFIVLLVLYGLTMINRDPSTFNVYEICFCVYAAGWTLDEIASMLEHGWNVYTQNLWSFLDITFVFIFVIYFALRTHGLVVDEVETGRQALDVLCIAAPVLLPRLAFNLMPENMLFITLRAMMGDFMVLTALAVWCFAGFLLAMRWLSMWSSLDSHEIAHNPVTIGKWMLWIWFGLDGTGIQRSVDFHMILGPVLMVTFAFVGNTLFLTILVSMLSNTFSKIVADATAEIQFRRTVLTFEGVKSDVLFAYRPPFNIAALLILLPLKHLLTPRWFHKINVAAVRILNAPFLLLIGLYERRRLWRPIKRPQQRAKGFWSFERFSAHGDIQAVFDAEPPQSVIEEIVNEDVIDDDVLYNGFLGGKGAQAAEEERRRQRWSSVVY